MLGRMRLGGITRVNRAGALMRYRVNVYFGLAPNKDRVGLLSCYCFLSDPIRVDVCAGTASDGAFRGHCPPLKYLH